MKTKAKIVEKLLEEKSITTEEAVILLQEQQIGFKQFPAAPIRENDKVPYHTICGCDVCNCIMGNRMVYPESSGYFTLHPTFTTTSTNCPNGPGDCNCNGSCKK